MLFWLTVRYVKGKGKVLPYLLPSVGPGADPSVQAVSPQVALSHPPGGRLPLLSTRPAITFPAEERCHPSAITKLCSMVTEARGCEQLAQGCYSTAQWPGLELAPSAGFHSVFIYSLTVDGKMYGASGHKHHSAVMSSVSSYTWRWYLDVAVSCTFTAWRFVSAQPPTLCCRTQLPTRRRRPSPGLWRWRFKVQDWTAPRPSVLVSSMHQTEDSVLSSPMSCRNWRSVGSLDAWHFVAVDGRLFETRMYVVYLSNVSEFLN